MSRSLNSETSRNNRPDSGAPRIVMQYFRGDTLVCELRTAGESLRVLISRGDDEGNRDNGWRIEAHRKVVDDDIVIGALGATRRAAFTEMCSKWSTQAPELGLLVVDWDAVAVALSSVRAIE